MKIISATEARRRAASADDRFLVQISNEIKAAAGKGEHTCTIRLDDVYTNTSASKYRQILEDAGYKCYVDKVRHSVVDASDSDCSYYYTIVISVSWR